jgi:acetyltransferase-like isoleucine patch superfamily enzyme
MTLGTKVLLDDFSVLDARGPSASITLGNYVSLGRYSSIVSKEAEVSIGDAVNIGSHCRVASQSRVEIGASTLIAAYCYIGPGNHQQSDSTKSLIEQPMDIKGGVTIGSHAWIGTRSTILDGVTIGENAIVGAHSLVRENVPANAIVAGVPAKIIRMRD